MACSFPLRAYKTFGGEIVFVERSRYDIVEQLSLPCGQCMRCRLERSRQWAMRCMHEASMHRENCFVTLTYSPEFLPYRGMLDYPAFQKFMKRLRKHFGQSRTVRFYMCGEYGEENWRPHYHSCLFGVDFADKYYWRKSESGAPLFRSPTAERLWPFGTFEIGRVTFESAAYVSRYCVQKITGPNAKAHYARQDEAGAYSLPPEFNHMSLKPGIGRPWLDKFKADVYPLDYVIVRGKKVKPPKFYDRLYAASSPEEFEALQFKRTLDGRSRYEDNTEERLLVKEQVAVARHNLSFRSQI